MSAWLWVRTDVMYAIHERQLAEHGGLSGILDNGRLESALSRPQNIAAYDAPDAAALAAAYACGLALNHGFADGNKRTAWVVARLFLADNGYSLSFDAADAVFTMESVATGMLSEAGLADWFRARMQFVRE